MSWECPCGITNKDSRIECQGCGLTLEETKKRLAYKPTKEEIEEELREFEKEQEMLEGGFLYVIFSALYLCFWVGMLLLYNYLLEREIIDKWILEKIGNYYVLIAFVIGVLLLIFISWADGRILNKPYHCPLCEKELTRFKPEVISKCSFCSVELPQNWWRKCGKDLNSQ